MLNAVFLIDKETKNTVRYAEEETDSPPIIGTIYVKKWAVRKMGGNASPVKAIRVTITPLVEAAE